MSPRLSPGKKITRASHTRNWKKSEQECAAFALKHDQPHPAMAPAMSVKGRVGQLNIPGMDVITKNYVWENKKKEGAPVGWLLDPLLKVLQRCQDWRPCSGVVRIDFQGLLKSNDKQLATLIEQLGLKRLPPIYIMLEPHFAKLLEESREGKDGNTA